MRPELRLQPNKLINTFTAALILFALTIESGIAKTQPKDTDSNPSRTDLFQSKVASIGEGYEPLSSHVTIQKNGVFSATNILAPDYEIVFPVTETGDLTVTSSVLADEKNQRTMVYSILFQPGVQDFNVGLHSSVSYERTTDQGIVQAVFAHNTYELPLIKDQKPSQVAVVSNVVIRGATTNIIEGFQKDSVQTYLSAGNTTKDGTLALRNAEELVDGAAVFEYQTHSLERNLVFNYTISLLASIADKANIYVFLGDAIPTKYVGKSVKIVVDSLNMNEGTISGYILDLESGEKQEFRGLESDETDLDKQIIEESEINFKQFQTFLPFLPNKKTHKVLITFLSQDRPAQ